MSEASDLAYKGWNPSEDTLALINEAGYVARDVRTETGQRPTLRQVYYQLVKDNIIPNSRASYQRLSNILTKARWAGLMSMDALEDRRRRAVETDQWPNPTALLRDAASWYHSRRWADDENHVEVWCEKDALSNVFEPITMRYCVPYVACGGFTSTTAIADAARRADGKPLVVLYFGDHDPSGIEMVEDIHVRLRAADIEAFIYRRALNRDQIAEHGCPPQPAKLSDSRARDYIAEHGRLSWELDALPLGVLGSMVEEAITLWLPEDWDERVEADGRVQRRLLELAENWRN